MPAELRASWSSSDSASRSTDQVKGSLLMDSMTQISEEHDFSAISEPDFDFDAIEIPDEGPLTFEFDLEVRPEFDMPKWKGLKLERLTREFTHEGHRPAACESCLRATANWSLIDERGRTGRLRRGQHRRATQRTRSSRELEELIVQIKPVAELPRRHVWRASTS